MRSAFHCTGLLNSSSAWSIAASTGIGSPYRSRRTGRVRRNSEIVIRASVAGGRSGAQADSSSSTYRFAPGGGVPGRGAGRATGSRSARSGSMRGTTPAFSRDVLPTPDAPNSTVSPVACQIVATSRASRSRPKNSSRSAEVNGRSPT